MMDFLHKVAVMVALMVFAMILYTVVVDPDGFVIPKTVPAASPSTQN